VKIGCLSLVPIGVVLAAVVTLAPAAGAAPVLISEYLEGTGNNKAIELYNAGGQAVNLAGGGWVLQIYYNGNTNAADTLALTGTVAAGGVYVIAHASASAAIRDRANWTTAQVKFNGNDAVVLREGGATGSVADAFGRVGEDPGAGWGTASNGTVDVTLRRVPRIHAGDPRADDPFDPAVEWTAFPCDDCTGLGMHAWTVRPPGGFLLRLGLLAAPAGPPGVLPVQSAALWRPR
jgi:predicted extracellular nuclease